MTAGREFSTVESSVVESVDRLEANVESERYRGYDPYDVLSSPIFRLPALRSSRWLRLAAQQALKRSPVNLRPLLPIPKIPNPVAVAFVLEASAYRARVDPEASRAHRRRALDCISELVRLSTRGYSGACWGYPFDWEARYGRVPAWTPTIVATGIVTNSLFTAYRLLQLAEAFAMCESPASIVLDDLPRIVGDGDEFCWGYSPGDRQRVLNATMKGARLRAQIHSVTGESSYRQAAAKTPAYVARRQRPDGSWPYAVGDARQWADNFHTADVRDGFDSYRLRTGDTQFESAKENGWRYYRRSFSVENRVPKYYSDRAYPPDATPCAQSLLTLCRFGDVQTAARVADWAIGAIQCSDGHFAYQVRRRRLIRIPYMRWSPAYMYAGLSRLLLALAEGRSNR
jgi:hypothetical protein